MAKAKKSTEVAILTQNDVPSMLETIEAQIKSLSMKTNSGKETSNPLTGFGRVEEISTVEDLIKAHASVRERSESYKRSAKDIVPTGIKIPEMILDGHTTEEWLSHIQSRVGEVTNEKKLASLKEMKKTLESNLSAELKLANDLAKIKKELEDGL